VRIIPCVQPVFPRVQQLEPLRKDFLDADSPRVSFKQAWARFAHGIAFFRRAGFANAGPSRPGGQRPARGHGLASSRKPFFQGRMIRLR
jgi:hypothetical protein